MKKKFSFLAQWTFPILLLFRSFWCNPFSWISFLLIQNCRDQFYQLCLDNDSSVLLPLRLPFISSLQLRDSKQIECKFEPCHRAFLIEMDGPFFLWSALGCFLACIIIWMSQLCFILSSKVKLILSHGCSNAILHCIFSCLKALLVCIFLYFPRVLSVSVVSVMSSWSICPRLIEP